LQPNVCSRPFAGSDFSCVPQPSSAGCMPSETKPSTDQVLTNTFIGFGRFERCVSRSAMWMPFTPSLRASSPQPSRLFGSLTVSPVSLARSIIACFTNHDTMPGFAPQVDTAVVPRGLLCLAASSVSRSA
jgi:hypothetical protein